MPKLVDRAGNPARILYVTSEEWFFASHFLHLAEAARSEGATVGVAAKLDKNGALAGRGFALYPLALDRGQRSFIALLRGLPGFLRILREFRPDLIHIVGLQNIPALAPLAAFFSNSRLVLAPIGLGQFWVETTAGAKFARFVIKLMLRILRGRRFFYLFENQEDAAELGLQDYPRKKIVGGAGVDENLFSPSVFPAAPPVKVAVVSRMLRSKGILTAIEAVRRARQSGILIELDLWGAPDPANASSLTEPELRALESDGIRWRGETNDVAHVLETSHIAMLLSAREGLPKSLLEAAACGRPVVATDVPGCRALIRNGIEGLLVPFDDAEAAAAALARLAQDQNLREKYGAAARARILGGFTQKQVQSDILSLYCETLN